LHVDIFVELLTLDNQVKSDQGLWLL
jgi:hypothetical protein